MEEGAPLGKHTAAVKVVVLAPSGVALIAGVVQAGEVVAGNRSVGLVASFCKLAVSVLVELADKSGHFDLLALIFSETGRTFCSSSESDC